jgi:hypothetical protein
MAKYLISFEKGAMDHIPEEDFPQVGKDSLAVIQEAKAAGVYVFSGGLSYDDGDVERAEVSVDGVVRDGPSPEPGTVEHAVVAVDGVVTDGPYPESKELIGGVLIVDVPTRDEALEWAAKTAAACRCAQDVRKFMYHPDA